MWARVGKRGMTKRPSQARISFGLGWVIAGCVLLSAGLAHAQQAEPGQDALRRLASRLDRVVSSRALRDARVSALVVRAGDGSTLYAHEPDRPLIPASNLKVLTAMAALTAFGPAHRFETPISGDRLPGADGHIGALYVLGSGDPALNSEDWWRVAVDLRSAGLRRVEGDLVLDDRAFDGVRWHPGWGPVSSRAYHAPVGGVMANYGAFTVTVAPGRKVGSPVRVEIDPPVAYLKVANRARTASANRRSTLVVSREGQGTSLVVNVDGTVPLGRDAKAYYRSVLDPARYAGSILKMHLEALGIEVEGTIQVGPVPETAVELLRFKGRPMAEIVRLFMKFSNNAVAESLVKAMGALASEGASEGAGEESSDRASNPATDGKDETDAEPAREPAREPGSWANGLEAVREHLNTLGVSLEGASIVDGSGLSYQNAVAPRMLVSALRAAHGSFTIGPEFIGALPIAARDGTLEKRAKGAERSVRAKTGLLNRVTTLSGFAEMPDGSVAVFSVLVNGYRVSDGLARAALDEFATTLVTD